MAENGAASSRIGILFALPEEAAPFQQLLKFHPKWRPYLTSAVSGVGAKNAAEAAKKLLATPGLPFDFVIVCGFAGGLHPSLQDHAIVAANSVMTYRGGKIVTETKCPVLPQFFSENREPGPIGKLVSGDRVLSTQADKQRVEAQTGGLFVDMETAGAVEVLEESGVEWLALRVITDTSSADLPLDFNEFTKADGNPDLTRIICHVLRYPRLVLPLLSFGRNAKEAARLLASDLERYLQNRFEPENKD